MASPLDRVPGPRLRRHVLSVLPGPTLLLLGVLSILVLTQDMLAFSDLVLNRGLEARVVAAIALDRAIPALAWMTPFAVLLGCLVALGKLASDGELFLIETSGISLLSLVRPLLTFALGMALVGAALSLWAAPAANQRLDARLDTLSQRKPWAHLQAGFLHRFGDYKLAAREVSPSGAELRGVKLYMPELGDTVFAESASLDATDAGEVRLTLENARSFPAGDGAEVRGRVLHAGRVTTVLPGGEETLTRDEVDRLAGSPLSELLASSERDARTALHRRFTWPVLTLCFGALAIPLFVRGARVSRAAGLALGIAVLAAYQGLVQAGNGLVWSGRVSPAVGTWLPVAIVIAVSAVLSFGLGRRPTFGPRQEPSRWRDRLRSGRPRKAGRRALDRYVARSFLELFAACFAAILVCYLIIDVLERVDRFVRYAPSAVELARFYAARIPLLASRVIPIALLVATAITVTLFGSRGELVGMRSLGIPAWRGLLPILVISAVAVPSSFWLNDRVIPHAAEIADRINDLIKERPSGASRVGVWFQDGDRFFEADLFDPDRGVAANLTVYELDELGLPLARTDARSAQHVGSGLWRLADGQRLESSREHARPATLEPLARLGDRVRGDPDTRHLSVAQVREEIGILDAHGVDTVRFEVDLWAKLATPLACLLLPMLALFFSLGGPPHPSTAATLVFSAAVAVVYTLAAGLGASLGYGGSLPPPAAAFAPSLIFASAALVLGRRLHILR